MPEAPAIATRTVRGVTLTELGLGAAQLGNLYRETTDEEAADTIDEAWGAGIRVFDTAPHYGLGLSERRLGVLLRRYSRDEYVLSTKVGKLLVPSPERAHAQDDEGFAVPAATRRVRDYSRDGVLRSLESSLGRLGTDRIDVVYLHDPDEPEQFAQASTEGVQALIELRDQGVVRAVGAGVYNSGLLSRPRPQAGATFDYAPASADVLDRANRIADECERHGVSLPEAAVAYPLLEPAVVCAVVGARGREQVASAVARYRAAVPQALWGDLGADSLVPLPHPNPRGSR